MVDMQRGYVYSMNSLQAHTQVQQHRRIQSATERNPECVTLLYPTSLQPQPQPIRVNIRERVRVQALISSKLPYSSNRW